MPLFPDTGLLQLIVTPVSSAEPEQHLYQVGLMNAVQVNRMNDESGVVAARASMVTQPAPVLLLQSLLPLLPPAPPPPHEGMMDNNPARIVISERGKPYLIILLTSSQ
jgi:hypothetical protein